MVRATINDKATIVSILVNSFSDNKSVHHIIPQDFKRMQRIGYLMEYAFDVCHLFGDVWLTADKLGCALLVKPDQKRTTVRSVWLDIRFVGKCIGFRNIKKAMQREAAIHAVHPFGPLYYLWFIGVEPQHQHEGIGTSLLKDIIGEASKQNRTICLETSTLKNISWYQQLGFSIYQELNVGYTLFCMKQ